MSDDNPILRRGDKVWWRKNGDLSPRSIQTVLYIERVADNSAEGEPVGSIAWADLNHAVVDLANGHWAYGTQLDPIPGDDQYARIIELARDQADTNHIIGVMLDDGGHTGEFETCQHENCAVVRAAVIPTVREQKDLSALEARAGRHGGKA